MKRHKRRSLGSTLGGVLLLLVAGFGLALALPAYEDYTIRSRVSAGDSAATAIRLKVAEFHAEHGRWPHDAGDLAPASLPWIDPGGIFSVHLLPQGVIEILTFAEPPKIPEVRLRYTPEVSPEGIVWRCLGTPPGLSPPKCRGTAG